MAVRGFLESGNASFRSVVALVLTIDVQGELL